MKWAFLLVAIISVWPLSIWLRQNPKQAPKVWTLMGILPFATEPLHLYMALISWAYWPGYVKGFEISGIDILGLAIFISLPKARSSLPFRFVLLAYFFAVLLSIFQAGVTEAAIFYLWQLARMFLIYALMVKACADDRVPLSVMRGMAIGILFEACIVIWQRVVAGELQAGGTFGHQNALGLASHFVTFPFFALFLARKRQSWDAFLVPIAGVIISLLTVSRATLGLAGAGFTITYLLSVSRQWTARKGFVAISSIVAIAALAPFALASFEARFAKYPVEGEYDERAAFESVALAILSDHPLGIGANNYVVVANTRGYNERANVVPTAGSLSAHVHNAYLLVVAETGYVGLVTFSLLLLRPLCLAFIRGWRAREDETGDVLLGLGVSLLIVYIHSLYEWVLVTSSLQYLFVLAIGLIAGLSQQLEYRKGGLRVQPEKEEVLSRYFINATDKY